MSNVYTKSHIWKAKLLKLMVITWWNGVSSINTPAAIRGPSASDVILCYSKLQYAFRRELNLLSGTPTSDIVHTKFHCIALPKNHTYTVCDK